MPKKELILFINSLLFKQALRRKEFKEKDKEMFTRYYIKTQGSDLYQDKPSPETPSIYR